jgi:hypothetical protein
MGGQVHWSPIAVRGVCICLLSHVAVVSLMGRSRQMRQDHWAPACRAYFMQLGWQLIHQQCCILTLSHLTHAALQATCVSHPIEVDWLSEA